MKPSIAKNRLQLRLRRCQTCSGSAIFSCSNSFIRFLLSTTFENSRMAENIQYSTVGFHLMKVSSCSNRVAPPNTAMMAKLTHSLTSTLPCRNFVQMICTIVAAIATEVAAEMPRDLNEPEHQET